MLSSQLLSKCSQVALGTSAESRVPKNGEALPADRWVPTAVRCLGEFLSILHSLGLVA